MAFHTVYRPPCAQLTLVQRQEPFAYRCREYVVLHLSGAEGNYLSTTY